ncbi:uncharacterized protein LOC143636448 [Bidens hawaiensis]|uniref:uncharacterized protein LOC143636448 n=1 Tax=Bidens hawaiensis TaxID=980011 RepID=UPI00404B719A
MEGPSDHTSPYYIHASDYPRQLHINDVLTDLNYNDWYQENLNFLFAKNKVGFIDGSIKKPEPSANTYMAWMRCDAMIKGWLTTAMEKEIRTNKWFFQFLHVTNDCSCGIGKKLYDFKVKERLYEFLLGLDIEYRPIRTQILAMQPTLTLLTPYHLVFEYEQQRVVSGLKRSTNDSAVFQAFVSNKRDANISHNKTIRKDGKKQAKHCEHCGKDRHNKDVCFKLVGYLKWWPGKGKQDKGKPRAACVEGETSIQIPGLTNEQLQQFVKIFGNMTPISNEQDPLTANATGNIGQEGLKFEDIDWSG